jgi:hypothetical protein
MDLTPPTSFYFLTLIPFLVLCLTLAYHVAVIWFLYRIWQKVKGLP